MDAKCPDAFVSGALAFVLQVSRIAGVAPLRFVKQHGGWSVSLSNYLHVYGCVMAAIINSITIVTVVLDSGVDHAHSIRMQTITRCIVWILDVSVMLGVVFHGTFAAPKHLSTMIACLNHLQKINYDLDVPHWPKKREMMKCFLLTIWMALTVTVTMIDYYIQSSIVQQKSKSVWVCVMYLFFYFCYWIMQLLLYQFVLITLRIRQCLVTVNDKLKTLSQGISDCKNVLFQSVMIQCDFAINRKRKKSANAVIDSLAFAGKEYTAEFTRPVHEKVRCLALTYLAICNIVKDIDQRYGTMLVLLFISFVLHLTITPYYLINNLLGNSETEGTLDIITQCLWCIYHFGNLVMAIEPCHLTLQEMLITKAEVSQLMRHSIFSQPLAVELDLFYRIIRLNKVSYSPLQITTFTRGMVATILGTIVTYLVVIIQI